MITERQIGLAIPQAAAAGRVRDWYPPLVDAMLRYGITSDRRIAFFLANVAEETGQLQARTENLNYSGDRLIQVFPSLFAANPDKAYELAAGGPQAVANYIYADAARPPGYRMGNTEPGDGWKYRGRGPMQITGKSNYRRFFSAVGMPADSDPDLLARPELGALSAAEYFRRAGCNGLADAGDFVSAVIKINGGTNGLVARQHYLKRFQEALSHPDPVAPRRQGLLAPVEPEPRQEVLAPEFSSSNKLAPALDPVAPMPPVPPAGYDLTGSGNVVRADVSESGIVKAAQAGQKMSWITGVLVTVLSGLQALKEMAISIFAGVSPNLLLILSMLAAATAIGCWFYFNRVVKKRIEMNRKGIA